MLQTIKDWIDDLIALPTAVQGVIYVVLLALVAAAVYFAGSNAINSSRVNKLEKENAKYAANANVAVSKMEAAQTQAANENLRSKDLESQLAIAKAAGTKQDEQILSSRQKTTATRRDLDRFRTIQPVSTSSDILDRRLKARYGQAGDAEPRK